MPAFAFKPRFAEHIRSGRKSWTIRAAVPRGFTVGLWMPFYTGMRTQNCALIGSGRATHTYEVRLDFDQQRVESQRGVVWSTAKERDAFAFADGFGGWADMEAFWGAEHPGQRQFTGQLMAWADFTTEHRLGGWRAS